jgi:hypothetical protein
MLSTDFDFYFREHANFYLGVFSADNYPKELNLFNFFIVNKDPSSEKGSHWMLVIRGKKNIEFFDSCGSSEEFVKKFLKFNKKHYCDFNKSPLQPITSEACGEFCIFFAHRRLLNKDKTFSNALNICFTHDLHKNNEKVLRFCNTFQKR